ncbi:hypothetical protein EOG37_02065 [Clavibacter michiganensis subsp. michiganensis]|nr:hypothetical protein [Clavibacter michiganensis subsp. michiganensis]MWJ05980.1 hypothetical protein [Clavibacter michiganensis subsp. michiganensis]MWJ08321.1 hypothetical protein [Clavibacter michiganensis subsp. michiganensis]MWJ35032.1 hypothetical protein [Clavibacter michiganensis subsp. michiganensis]MWJ80828.1 hypothetical protein [Clavibacter michiganensis subsp. michiganensis]
MDATERRAPRPAARRRGPPAPPRLPSSRLHAPPPRRARRSGAPAPRLVPCPRPLLLAGDARRPVPADHRPGRHHALNDLLRPWRDPRWWMPSSAAEC